MVESILLKPVKAYKCPRIAAISGADAANFVPQSICDECNHCAQIRTPWHRFGVRCVYPATGDEYWQALYKKDYQIMNDPHFLEAPAWLRRRLKADG